MTAVVPPLFLPSRWPKPVHRVLLALAWFGLTVSFFQPAAHVLDGRLDPSIFTAYAYYTAHGMQFGPEVVGMAGPYGFVMYGLFYGGELFWLRFVLELALQGVLAALVLWFFLRGPRTSGWRWLIFPAHLLFSLVIADLTVAWTMLLAGFFLLEKPAPGRRAVRPVLAAALLGWLALFKGTHLALSLATIGVVALAWGFGHRRRHAGLLLGTYLASLLLCWLLARQNPLNLPAYLLGTLHLAQAYNGAMSVDEPSATFWRGAAVTLSFMFACGITAWLRRRDGRQVAAVALLAGYSFVMWKHGFVRADEHVTIFYCFTVVAAITWYLYFFDQEGREHRRARMAAGGFVLVFLLGCLGGSADPLRPSLTARARITWPSIRYRLGQLITAPAARAEIEHRLQEQRDKLDLPETRDTIGQASLDFFGVEQGVVPLNRFNYHPRPMAAGTFNVYDPYLMNLNRDFLRDPARRPAYYLVRPGTINERFLTQDDGAALVELIQGYRPVVLERNFLLMEARPIPALAPVPLAAQTVRFGQTVTVPRIGDDQLLLARFVIRDSLAGRLRAALYKPPVVTLTLQDEHGQALGTRRLIPGMAVSSFLFSPVIESNADLLDLCDRTRGRQIGRFVVSTGNAACFAREFTVEFQSLARPPPLDAFVLRGLRARLQFPFANAVPESISPAFREHNSVRFLHAPGEAVWALRGDEREFTFHYGLAPEAYERGTTNGVKFIVEVRGPSGGVTRAFAHLLKPVTNPADRGKHIARVQLPIHAPGSRLVLRTDPGEYGDSAWDWSYVTRIELRPGRYAAEQFPGFNRVPDSAEDENAAVLELDGRKVLLLHVPGLVRFNLTGGEKQLAFDFGFLPGAYQDGGNTAGADCVVDLQRGDQPPREIFRRTLRPVTAPADRGRQSAVVSLPDVAPGDLLVLRTAVAPGGNNSWGWTYVGRLAIE